MQPGQKKLITLLTAFRGAPHWCFFSLLLASCAQIVAPSGGKKDTVPPKVVKYTPDSAQLNFNSKKIELDFNEFIQLKDLNTQLIISPPMEKTPDIKMKNKSVIIDLGDEKLKPNTTYSISFGTALQDLNEGNPIDNFKYIFSTGDYIDSLAVTGKVQAAFDHKTEKGVLVMLYSDLSDSIVYRKPPDYFGKTKEDGTFTITNVHPGIYKLFALKDDNSDYKYTAGESIGFIEGTIDPSENKSILVDLFQEAPKKFFVKKYSQPDYGRVLLIFNTGSDSVKVKNLDPAFRPEQELQVFSKNNDTLVYWVKDYESDSLKLQVSNGNTVTDTLEFKLIKKEDALKSKRNPLKLRLLNNFSGNRATDLGGAIVLQFSQPIATINVPEADLKADSIPVKKLFYSTDPGFPPKPNNILLITRDSTATAEDPGHAGVFVSAPVSSVFTGLKEDTKYHLLILPGTFTDIYGLTNDSIRIDFKTQELKYYGTIKLKVGIPDSLVKEGSLKPKDYIVQLLDDKGNLYRQKVISGTETLNFENIRPLKYQLKIIIDKNGNGKWDTGNYSEKRQPENVIYDSEEVNVRSNWDLDLEWKVNY